MSSPTLYEQLGGEPALRAIIDDFVERIFADVMIGYFFAKADKARIKAKEFEFAARHLGYPMPYTGQALPAAHARHRIMGGHFMRRLQILKETLQAHHAPQAVIEHWLQHTESMRHAITTQAGSQCIDVPAAEPQAPAASPLPPPRNLPFSVSDAQGAAGSSTVSSTSMTQHNTRTLPTTTSAATANAQNTNAPNTGTPNTDAPNNGAQAAQATTTTANTASPDAAAQIATSNAPVNSQPTANASAGGPGQAGARDAARPMPSVEQIQAYLEQSAARTKLRLPLAFNQPASETRAAAEAGGATTPAAATPSAAKPTSRALPLTTSQASKSRTLPLTQDAGSAAATPSTATPSTATPSTADPSSPTRKA